jgi:hypothetical protein
MQQAEIKRSPAARPLLALLVLLSISWSSRHALAEEEGGAALSDSMHAEPMSPDQAREFCAPYQALFANIDTDLARWKANGISADLMSNTVLLHTTRSRNQKGFAAGFRGGKAVLLDRPPKLNIGHHVQLLFVYMKVLLHLERMFQMPDVVSVSRGGPTTYQPKTLSQGTD